MPTNSTIYILYMYHSLSSYFMLNDNKCNYAAVNLCKNL